MAARGIVVVAALALLAAAPGLASDHADPQVLETKEAGLTDLFFFPHGEDYIAILCVRPALTDPPPYNLSPFTYVINFDLHTKLSFASAADKARYGGTVTDPAGIKADASIRYSLSDDASLKSFSASGLTNVERIRKYTGVRDDPFIFPRFFGKNTIAAVFAIPKSSFPAGQEDFVIYGEAWEHGGLVDTVGRSNRSQNGRYRFLRDVPANLQAAEIRKQFERTGKVYRFLQRETWTAGLAAGYHELLQLYPYDLANPDVMIFTTKFAPGYPNGRQLTDDVAYISCQYGDCALMSLSYAESDQFPRATRNDRDFQAGFPFLAEPWPPSPAPKRSGIGCGGVLTIVVATLFVLAVVAWFVMRKKWRAQYPSVGAPGL